MQTAKEKYEYELSAPLQEALRDVHNVFNNYRIMRGDMLLSDAEAAEHVMTDVLVWSIQHGKNYRSQIDTAIYNAREITGLTG